MKQSFLLPAVWSSIVVVVLFCAASVFASEKILVEFDSAYHHIKVVQDGSIRGLKFDNNYFQSKMDVNNPFKGYFGYIDLLFEVFLFKPDAKNMLMLGLGGGSAQKLMHHYQKHVNLLTVELDPAVVEVAEKYFFYDSKAMPVIVSDARMYLKRSKQKYDVIIQDTYSSNRYGTFIPYHLATLEYFTLVKDRLNDDGVFAINVIGTIFGGEPNRIIDSVYKTMAEVFPQLYLFAAEDVQNVVIIATLNNKRMKANEIMNIARELVKKDPDGYPPGFIKRSSSQFYDTLPSMVSRAIILTDDYAPTDNLLR